MDKEDSSSYKRRPLWQWVLIYAIGGLAIYALFYFFLLPKPDRTDSVSTSNVPNAQNQITPTPFDNNQSTVELSANGFSPEILNIKTGTEVIWKNNSGNDATINSDPHPIHTNYQPLNLGRFSDGETRSLTFDQPGTYGYHNHLDPAKTGKIVVE